MATDAGSAHLSVEGKAVTGGGVDGAFSFALSKDETRFVTQEDDQPWEPVLTAAYAPSG
jgi:hypothetical protein